jgi:hypothetical protein
MSERKENRNRNLGGGGGWIPVSVGIIVGPGGCIVGTARVGRSLLLVLASGSSVGERRGRASGAGGRRRQLNDGAEAAHGRHVEAAGDVGGGHGEGGSRSNEEVRFNRVWGGGGDRERHQTASEEKSH